jgi:hypothetical protein
LPRASPSRHDEADRRSRDPWRRPREQEDRDARLEDFRSLAGETAGVIALFGSANPYVQVAGGILAAVSGGAYTHSRGKVKSAK